MSFADINYIPGTNTHAQVEIEHDQIDSLLGALTSYWIIQDVKSIATNGGTFTSGAWQTRDLNTITVDEGGSPSEVTLASNQFTITEGKYRIHASCPAWDVDEHQCRLFDVTNTASIAVGTCAFASDAGTNKTQSRTFLDAGIDISSTTTFRIEHQCAVTKTNTGFGRSCGFGDEVYTTVVIVKVT